jgi:hypothetical protein
MLTEEQCFKCLASGNPCIHRDCKYLKKEKKTNIFNCYTCSYYNCYNGAYNFDSCEACKKSIKVNKNYIEITDEPTEEILYDYSMIADLVDKYAYNCEEGKNGLKWFVQKFGNTKISKNEILLCLDKLQKAREINNHTTEENKKWMNECYVFMDWIKQYIPDTIQDSNKVYYKDVNYDNYNFFVCITGIGEIWLASFIKANDYRWVNYNLGCGGDTSSKSIIYLISGCFENGLAPQAVYGFKTYEDMIEFLYIKSKEKKDV